MGQPITVVEHKSSRPGIVRYEINRSLTGMGHERYVAGRPIEDQRPVDELARRLFARGGIDAVHVNGSVVTVELARGFDADGLADIIRDLYLYYREPAAEDSAAPAAGGADTPTAADTGDAAVAASGAAPAP
jgi:hypothetical protein